MRTRGLDVRRSQMLNINSSLAGMTIKSHARNKPRSYRLPTACHSESELQGLCPCPCMTNGDMFFKTCSIVHKAISPFAVDELVPVIGQMLGGMLYAVV